jgi:methionine sulfoxide reductase heme-binding subunit
MPLMQRMRGRAPERWALVGWTALGVAALVAGLLGVHGTGSAGLGVVIRGTARVAVVLFLLAFSASSLRRLWRSPSTAWLLSNRRYIGVSFAVVHFTHLGAIAASAIRAPAPFFQRNGTLAVLGGGGLAYLLLAGMTVTSFDRTAAWLGRTWWRRLHLGGSYLLWLIFLQTYAARTLLESSLYAPLALALIAAFALRIWSAVAGRRTP